MKSISVFTFLIFFSLNINAQNYLSESRQSGYYTYIYKLSDKEMYDISVKGNHIINDSFLHTLVDSFQINKKYNIEILPLGNYIYATPVKNNWQYSVMDLKNVELAFVNNGKDFQFYLKDIKGKLVNNAKVTVGKRSIAKLDHTTGLYKSRYRKKNQVIQVHYQGVNNFFVFEIEEQHKPYYYDNAIKRSFKRALQSVKKTYKKVIEVKPNTYPYRGYIAFSKPMYKPLDTVKFKAYIVTSKGENIKKQPANIFIYEEYRRDANSKKIASINPYQSGAYEYSFVLSDSLGLTLDKSHFIEIKEVSDKKPKSFLKERFRYEDYELKRISFNMRTDKKEYHKGSPVTLYMSAKDENHLDVPDGRVELVAISQSVNQYHENQVFIPDTLWKKELTLEPIGETKVIIPDSVFPKASFQFSVEGKFFNSNNESRSAKKTLDYVYYDGVLQEILTKLEKDSLYIEYFENGLPVACQLQTKYYSFQDELIDSLTIQTPAKIKVDYSAQYYDFEAENGFEDTYFITDNNITLSVSALQTKDSLKVVVFNEHKIPFWYTVFSGQKELFRGYGLSLDTLVSHKANDAAHIRVNYFLDGTEKIAEASAFYHSNYLNVKLIAPDVVYPGQKVNMLVNVTDIEDNPISNTDVTAYAATSKFSNFNMPQLPFWPSKKYSARKIKNKVEVDESVASGVFKLKWLKWAKTLGLDTIEYYKFTHPEDLYILTENTKNNITQISPFVIYNDKIEPVNVVYIDDIPVFYSQSDQLQSYAFEVKPGKHKITMRTANKKVVVDSVEIVEGKKTILSVSANPENKKAVITSENIELSSQEAHQLDRYMMRITKPTHQYEKVMLIKPDSSCLLLKNPAVFNNNSELLIGPVKENVLTYKTETFAHNFLKEPGYTYTFLPNFVKQKSFKTPYAFNTRLSLSVQNNNDNYKQEVITKKEIDSIWNNYLDIRSYVTVLFHNYSIGKSDTTGILIMKLQDTLTNELPYLKNIILYHKERPDLMFIYPGNNYSSRHIYLYEGKYKAMFLLKDNSYYIADNIIIKPKGINRYSWDNLRLQPSDIKSEELDAYIKSVKGDQKNSVDLSVIEKFVGSEFDKSLLIRNISGRVLDDKNQPIIGAIIKVVGLPYVVSTDIEGYFKIKAPDNAKIMISYIGYIPHEIFADDKKTMIIRLKEDVAQLQEVVVLGYESVKKGSFTENYAVVEALQGRVAGMSIGNDYNFKIRGFASLVSGNDPLIILDGKPFTGDFSQLDIADIGDISILRDAASTAIYGARGANGVIIIKTKQVTTLPVRNNYATADNIQYEGQNIRTNFSDEGFWKPKLITDVDGNAAFTVKFPDDITSWKTNVIAMNGRKQIGTTTASIKSYKSLSANLTSPQFAVEDDSIHVIGKLMNYLSSSEKVNRKMLYNGKELLNSTVNIENSFIDTISVKVSSQDTLIFKYTLTQENGYFDGEIRKINVIPAGVKETKGYFAVLSKDTTVRYTFDANLGAINVRAENSVIPVLTDEIVRLKNYEYDCNEQLASKLKALLLEQQVKAYYGQKKEYDRNINSIIKKLNANKKTNETWGWWKNSDEELWISLHIVDALIKAEKQGYKVSIDKEKLHHYLVGQLAQKQDYTQLNTIELLHLIDNKYEIKDWIKVIENNDNKPSQYEKLKLMHLKQAAGLKIDVSTLLTEKKQTILGNSYWGDDEKNSSISGNNNVQNTLLAYRILKTEGNHQEELNKILYYFLEQRKDGQWRNTYESALILETILPDALEQTEFSTISEITINGERITHFPYQNKSVTNEISVSKPTGRNIYFTAYQQFQNAKPEKINGNFIVRTSFLSKNTEIPYLKAGESVILQVEIEVKANADYVMIEVPIPSGCSYKTKQQNYFQGVEVHREYFKEKTSIFCNHLKPGKYTFDIDLMPRYSGIYTLNPAKVEMMYFPVFYGREELKKVVIK